MSIQRSTLTRSGSSLPTVSRGSLSPGSINVTPGSRAALSASRRRAGRHGAQRGGPGVPLPGIWYRFTFRAGDLELEMPVEVREKMRAVLNTDGTVSTLPSQGPKNVRPVDLGRAGVAGRGALGRGSMGGAGTGFGRSDTWRGGGLTTAQQAMVATITRVMESRDIPDEVIKAAIVNAVAESGLNPNAVGDGGKSVGLFQLHERGAGHGMSVADRKDPVKNTNRIVDTYLGSQGKPMRAAYTAGERRISELAALWSANVERPADKLGEMARRRVLAGKLFPAGSGSAGSGQAGSGSLPSSASVAGFDFGKVAVGIALAALAAALFMRGRRALGSRSSGRGEPQGAA